MSTTNEEVRMVFVSLGDTSDEVSFETALSRGIAPDGSLYYPKTIPQFSTETLQQLPSMPAQDIDKTVLKLWLGDELSDGDLSHIVETAATFETPINHVGDKHVLELFHGPTMAFKDVAARYLAAFMGHFNSKTGRTSTVLVATSGDTGGAIAHGFGGISGVKVVVLYPKGRVSKLQAMQLRRVSDNVRSLEIAGDFDDCQALVKQAFADKELSAELNLTSANSISIGRLLPQITYYVRTYAALNRDDLRIVVPSGNLGNVTAGLFAYSMGLPIKKFLAANNANDALHRLLETGVYTPMQTIQTASNAMDVGAPNNLPRLMRIFGDSVDEVRNVVNTSRVTDEQTAETIRRVYSETGYLLDPHTAVGWYASESAPSELHDVVVSTASPLKFADEIETLTGIHVDNTAELQALEKVPERYSEINSDFNELREFLLEKRA